jgi:hypothetical protein
MPIFAMPPSKRFVPGLGNSGSHRRTAVPIRLLV